MGWDAEHLWFHGHVVFLIDLYDDNALVFGLFGSLHCVCFLVG